MIYSGRVNVGFAQNKNRRMKEEKMTEKEALATELCDERRGRK